MFHCLYGFDPRFLDFGISKFLDFQMSNRTGRQVCLFSLVDQGLQREQCVVSTLVEMYLEDRSPLPRLDISKFMSFVIWKSSNRESRKVQKLKLLKWKFGLPKMCAKMIATRGLKLVPVAHQSFQS